MKERKMSGFSNLDDDDDEDKRLECTGVWRTIR